MKKDKKLLLNKVGRLWHHIGQKKNRHRQYILLFTLMILSVFTEIASLGAVIPFIGVLAEPEYMFSHPMMQPVIQFIGLSDENQLVTLLTILFIVAAIVAGIVRLTLLYLTIKLSFATGADLSINIYRLTLFQPYKVHISRNSSELINGVINKTNTIVTGVVMSSLTLISSVILMFGIIFTLFIVNPIISIITFFGFGSIYWVIAYSSRANLHKNSEIIARESTQVIKSLQEGLGGIRDVLVNEAQQFYIKLYRDADLPMRKAMGDNQFIGNSPRYIMEALGVILIAIIAHQMSKNPGGLIGVLPVLGILALGAQRLLPIFQQGYASFTSIRGSYSSLCDVLDLLDQPLEKSSNENALSVIPFQNYIVLSDVSFRYSPKESYILSKINLKFSKGNRIGILGKTGSGKSTLLDILMGLLIPSNGSIEVDGNIISKKNIESWRKQITHVPQHIYLSDGSIAENIAFGHSKESINYTRLKKSAKDAQIDSLIESWPMGYQTTVGERGVQISGGQRQRIGIARALYKSANVIIFDEATSALDRDTEKDVLKAIENLTDNVTIFMVAHRVSTLKNCDKVYEVGNGQVKEIN
jgi:ATP-binding cassette, subfamily B, bacterial PglK